MTQKGFKRKPTAILSADAVGYSRLMGEDEEATVRTLTAYREVIGILINDNKGRLVDSPGDNILAEFASVVDSLRCARDIQQEIKSKNSEWIMENRGIILLTCLLSIRNGICMSFLACWFDTLLE